MTTLNQVTSLVLKQLELAVYNYRQATPEDLAALESEHFQGIDFTWTAEDEAEVGAFVGCARYTASAEDVWTFVTEALVELRPDFSGTCDEDVFAAVDALPAEDFAVLESKVYARCITVEAK